MKYLLVPVLIALSFSSIVFAQQQCPYVSADRCADWYAAQNQGTGNQPQNQTTAATQTTGSRSISGDDLCGSSANNICKLSNLKDLAAHVATLVAGLGAMVVVAILAMRVAWGLVLRITRDNPAEIAKARNDAFQGLLGFAIALVAIGGGLSILLQALGANPWTMGILNLLSFGIIEHAYAQGTELRNPLGSNNLFDIVISVLNLAIKFFVYPAVVAAWVASGFKFIYSRGNPEGLKTARSWLLSTFIVTIVVFTIQGFVLALKNTANKILPRDAQTQNQNKVSDDLV